MKKLVFLSIILVSCSSNDSFCDCLEAGENLNEFSATLFEDEPTLADKEKLKELRNKKDKACEAFSTMSGEELLKRKKNCTDN